MLVIVDHFTKLAVVVPTRDQTAESDAEALWKKFILIYGCTAQLHSVQGASFEGRLSQAIRPSY